MRRLGSRLHQLGQREEGHAFELHVELAPGRDTMKIANVFELRESHELLPVQRDRLLNLAVDLQLPLVERDIGTNPQVEHGEVVDLPLPRRQTILRAAGRPGFARHLLRPTFLGRDVLLFHERSEDSANRARKIAPADRGCRNACAAASDEPPWERQRPAGVSL